MLRLFKAKADTKRSIYLLNPDKPKDIAVQEFEQKRIKLCMLVMLGTALIIAVLLFKRADNQEPNRITRGGYGDDSYIISRDFIIDGSDKKRSIDIEVFPQEYSEAEAMTLMSELQKELPELILMDNKSLAEVRGDLNLIDSAYDDSIYISWNGNEYVSAAGAVNNLELPDEGAEPELEYRMHCGEYSISGSIPIRILPPAYTEDEAIMQSVRNEIKRADGSSRSKDSYELPNKINGVSINWLKDEGQSLLPLSILILTIPVIVYCSYESRLTEALKKRRQQLMVDYYELANKIILYMEAGIAVKTGFALMAREYSDRKQRNRLLFRYAYEEILIMCREMDSGKSEQDAYESCGRRCELVQYKKLFGYMAQAVKKGSGFVGSRLRSDLREGFELRRATAIRAGEEASTKLMLPMLMILGIVIAILMIPAFMAFGI